MTEETNEQQTKETQETQEQTEEKKYSKAEVEKRMAGPIGQVNELRAELDAIRKQKAADEEAKAIKNKDFQSVIDNLKAQLVERDQNMLEYQTKIKNQEIDSKLLRSGIKDDFARTGVLAHYNGLEEKPELDAYIAGLKESHSTIFESAVNKGRPSGNPGIPSVNTVLPLSERLKSSDPKVAQAALDEQFVKTLKGEPLD